VFEEIAAMLVVAIVAQGEMGAGIARRLTESGAQVLTSLEGRGPASRRRAAEARMDDVSWERIAEADLFLSILPPGQALPLAEAMARAWAGRERAPLYVDCNAISPATVEKIGVALAASGTAFVDAGIIGGPPQSGEAGPKIYASGPHAARLGALRGYGLTIEQLDGPVGAASALKMSYGGITKGITAIGAVMALAAIRAGADRALARELSESQAAMFAWLKRQCVGMIPKAYRWVAEMEEIAEFHKDDAAGADLYEAIARLYARLAADAAAGSGETDRLRDFFR
jgi:3-hydroxyisobutyrate dehydrogenase-like beta-hydroxyacid dehydrogenase